MKQQWRPFPNQNHCNPLNRPFARWRLFTTKTRIHFIFYFIFKFGKITLYWGSNNKSLYTSHEKVKPWRILVVVVKWCHSANGLLKHGVIYKLHRLLTKCNYYISSWMMWTQDHIKESNWMLQVLGIEASAVIQYWKKNAVERLGSSRWKITGLFRQTVQCCLECTVPMTSTVVVHKALMQEGGFPD